MPSKKKPVKRKRKSGVKQKQKQRQQVNVNVSAGGAGGGGFIPIPQAPSPDISALMGLLRPANVTPVPLAVSAREPIREQVVRPAEPPGIERPAMESQKNIPSSRRRQAGETDEEYNARMVQYEAYLARKSEREKAQRKRANQPTVEAQVLPEAEDEYGGGGKYGGSIEFM